MYPAIFQASKVGARPWRAMMFLVLALLMPPVTLAQSPAESTRNSDEVEFQLRYRQPTSTGSERFHTLTKTEQWDPARSAIIVCDMWDSHHSQNAVKRVQQLAPRINQLLQKSRTLGMTIVHAPSDCMDFYQNHAARRRAQEMPAVDDMPDQIKLWCSKIPAEEQARYPIDQSDGGADDDPKQHKVWVRLLEQQKRDPSQPWRRQVESIEIEREDFISDRGDEIWNILENRSIENVILVGVHTNMCVLGRPFGLRQLARNGKNVVLMRDLTDTMYNPKRWPFVSHFTGTDLIVEYIEKHICPTVTSDQVLGGREFRFKKDKRPHLVIVLAEDEYKTNETLPQFAAQLLGHHFRVSYVFASEDDRNDLPGLAALTSADMALFSVRRRTLSSEQMKIVQDFVNTQGKSVIGIRTSSHAFSLRDRKPSEGHEVWPEFDQQTFGGHYTGHFANELLPTISSNASQSGHPLLTGLHEASFKSGGSLYQTSPSSDQVTILLRGTIDTQKSQPVAWTFSRKPAGGYKSFYTSLGHAKDFQNPYFRRLLVNSLFWGTNQAIPVDFDTQPNDSYEERWVTRTVPDDWSKTHHPQLNDREGFAWYRCLIRLDQSTESKRKVIQIDNMRQIEMWFNGQKLSGNDSDDGSFQYPVEDKWCSFDDLNLLAIRIKSDFRQRGLTMAPTISIGDRNLELAGKWQLRLGDDESFAKLDLPPKFAASVDSIFE